MPDIKLLDKEKDKDDLLTAWRWADDAPEWFKDTQNAWKEGFDEFLRAENELVFGIYDTDLFSMVRLIQAKGLNFVCHLYAKRTADFDTLLQACASIRDYLRDKGAESLYGYIPKQNRSIRRLYEKLGFHDTGVRCYKGVVRNRVIEWRQYLVNMREIT